MLLWVSAGLEKICTLDSAQMPGGDRKNISHVWRFCISGSGSDITRYSSSVGRKIDFESVHIIYWEEFDLKNKLKIIIKRKNLFRIFSISVHSSGYLSDRWLSCTGCLRDIVCVCVCVGGGGYYSCMTFLRRSGSYIARYSFISRTKNRFTKCAYNLDWEFFRIFSNSVHSSGCLSDRWLIKLYTCAILVLPWTSAWEPRFDNSTSNLKAEWETS